MNYDKTYSVSIHKRMLGVNGWIFIRDAKSLYDWIYCHSGKRVYTMMGLFKFTKEEIIDINMLFGDKIKELREEQGLLQRQLAAFLEIDTPMFSKIERGDRRAKREQVIKLAEYLHQDEKKMLTLWLADKFIDAVEDEQERDLCNDAIIVAQEKIKTL